MLVECVCVFYGQDCRGLCLTEVPTPSIYTSVNVPRSDASLILNDSENKSSAYCGDGLLEAWM